MTRVVRRGLPRVPGGEPWPPATVVPTSSADLVEAAESAVDGASTDGGAAPGETSSALGTTSDAPATGTVPLRRGLPRVAGGDAWPPAGFAPARITPLPEPVAAEPGGAVLDTADTLDAAADGAVDGTAAQAATVADAPDASDAPDARAAGAPEPEATGAPVTPVPDAAPAAPAATRRKRAPLPAWAARTARLAVVALALLVVAVLGARWLVDLAPVQDFLATYDGTAPLPADAPVGIPAWLAWQHFFNLFLIVLVVRTGLQVRRERKPAAYWAPRSAPSAKIGLTSWTHQTLDVLWIANGAIYVVMLFATGQWVRIVPTSWTVFPQAVSSALQYLSLDWPTENGWIHYNGLQQLTYFVTVFVAAPLAVATGVRMSRYWRSTPALDRVFPVQVARKLHFPVMIYFVAFIVSHVGLVLATGALRNLNHMFAGRDDTSWVGLGVFALVLVVVVGAAVALRPVLVAPVARLFGTVTSR